MNRRPLFLKPQQAVPGFLQQKTAEGLSPTTLLSYKHWLAVWLSHTPKVSPERIKTKTQDMREFFCLAPYGISTPPLFWHQSVSRTEFKFDSPKFIKALTSLKAHTRF